MITNMERQQTPLIHPFYMPGRAFPLQQFPSRLPETTLYMIEQEQQGCPRFNILEEQDLFSKIECNPNEKLRNLQLRTEQVREMRPSPAHRIWPRNYKPGVKFAEFQKLSQAINEQNQIFEQAVRPFMEQLLNTNVKTVQTERRPRVKAVKKNASVAFELRKERPNESPDSQCSDATVEL